MRNYWITVAATAIVSSVAQAADKPIIAPAPAWVKPVSAPAGSKADETPVQILLSDQQIALTPGKQTVYSAVTLKIQTPQGLAAGNISLPWRPDTDELIVHKLLIRRGSEVIDVLASGQTFTVMRRETNLESATLDGVLTANIQPEGLQVGDILEFAASVTTSDPVMQGHVEQVVGAWDGAPIGRAHLRMLWPSSVRARVRQTGGLPALKPIKAGETTMVELSLDNLFPTVAPKGAPPRYDVGRLVEVTDFASWADLGALMAPLYVKAAKIPPQGPLRVELERIRSLSADPKVRAEAALVQVQDKIRYVALAMGSGGLVPADAGSTWSRRYGDCKGKTALLLALLHELGIEADPVAVSTRLGDGLDSRLPMVGAFDHVLVRAKVAGRTYWMDGTRTGDARLDGLAVPAFGWGLPLLPKGAALVRMMPEPLETPSHAIAIHLDARAGLTVPAPAKLEVILRGDEAIGVNIALANLTGAARDNALRDYWKSHFDFIDPRSTEAVFNRSTGELRLAMSGLAKMDWSSGWYETDGTSVGYAADFSRAAGADADAPFAVPYPYFSKTVETILLPPGFSSSSQVIADVDRTLAGIEYRRRATLANNVFTIEKTERSVVPEFPAKDAPAAQIGLRELAQQTVFIRKPKNYRPTEQEVAASLLATPTSAQGFVQRGHTLLEHGRYDEAIKDFDRAHALDPKNVWALANRGISYAWKGEHVAAAKDLDAAHAMDARNPVVFRGRGFIAEQKGAFQEAVTAYTTALEIEPGSEWALARRAAAHRAMQNLDAAFADSAAALKLNPRLTDLYLLRANILRGQGKREEAISEAGAAAAANPDDSYAQVVAGNIYAAHGLREQALRAYDRALAIKPEAYIYLNRALRRPPGDSGRLADIEAALKLEPDMAEAVTEKGDLLIRSGDFAGAIATFSAALAKMPDDHALQVRRGIAYHRAGDRARAEADFAQARANATDARALNHLCWAKATAGIALETALSECDLALSKAPDSPAYRDSRGLVLLRLGRIEEAIAEYDRALAKSPNQAASLFGRAAAWARKGDKKKSKADAAAALEADPDVQSEFDEYGIQL
jgi:tetratricopeptide (TPR) repeat protein